MVRAPPMTAEQLAQYGQDRRPDLYASLIVLLVINNAAAGSRFVAQWRAHYRHDFRINKVFAEDYFIALSALCIDAVIGNLLAATYYGLGLHSWRINAEDPNYPQNLSNTFRHVWVCMVLTGPTFTAVKLALLFFYRRLFLINQRWLRITWRVNVVYVILWLVGATGFYVFQCWPVQWYFMQYYQKFNRPPPYPISGQCDATTTMNVAIPLIFGLLSDISILVLPLATIFNLHMSSKSKIGLTLVFSVGIIACVLDMVRIIELIVDTDDKIDPSYGVVVFLILSAATEVAAIVCASMPIVGPQALKMYKRYRHPSYNRSSKLSLSKRRGPMSSGFEQLDNNCAGRDRNVNPISLSPLEARGEDSQTQNKVGNGVIWVRSEVSVRISEDRGAANTTPTNTMHAT